MGLPPEAIDVKVLTVPFLDGLRSCLYLYL